MWVQDDGRAQRGYVEVKTRFSILAAAIQDPSAMETMCCSMEAAPSSHSFLDSDLALLMHVCWCTAITGRRYDDAGGGHQLGHA